MSLSGFNIDQPFHQSLAIAHNNYAVLLGEMKRYEEAESHYKEALRINPEYATATEMSIAGPEVWLFLAFFLISGITAYFKRK